MLWGEPGFGKTHELLKAYDALGPEHAEFINLRSIIRAEDLRQALDRSPSFRAWQNADVATWTLFLDGFDEACVRTELLHSWLASAFRIVVGALTKTRIARIRITGRVAEWSKLVENDLNDLWGPEAVAKAGFGPSLSATPDWKCLPIAHRERLVALARRYLNEKALRDVSWLGTKRYHAPAAAAYRAFRLLAEFPTEFESLSQTTWAKWAAAIVGLPGHSTEDERDIQASLASACRGYAPDEYLEAVCRVVAGGQCPTGFDHVVKNSLSPRHADVVFNSVLRSAMHGTWRPDEASIGLVMLLVSHGCDKARALARANLQSRDDTRGADEPLSFGEIVGASFALYCPRRAWPFLSRKVAIAPARGWAMLAWIAEKIWLGQADDSWDYLDEPMKADVCEWTRNWLATSGRLPTHLGKVGRRVLDLLATYPTEAAVSELERLSRAFPNEPSLKSRAEKARYEIRKWAWKPSLPREVLRR